jgi:hypothetical protein
MSMQHLESEHARKEAELHAQWLAAQERAIAAEQALARARAQTELYRVEVHTGDRKGAGTDAGVFLEVLGAAPGHSSGELWLGEPKNSPPGYKPFQRGSVDRFELPGHSLPSEMRRVRVGHDGSGSSPGWFLEKVVVTRVGQGVEERKEFLCGRWLSATEEDGKLVRELTAGDGATSSGNCR